MNTPLKNTLATTVAILTLSVALPAHTTPTNIADNYVGGDDHGYGDVIGKKSIFDIQSMDVELTGNMLSVSINTNFAGYGDEGLFSGYTYGGTGIGYGDLFLSDSWSPVGAAPYLDDNYYAAGTTSWSYAFSLNDRFTDGGEGSLYSLTGNDILLSEDFLSGATFRNGQEIAVDTTNKVAVSGSTTAWTVTDTSVNFLIDLTGTSLAGSSTIALHWGMTCGNDTIEGEYSVPEPAMLGLLALGLIGIGVGQRRKS